MSYLEREGFVEIEDDSLPAISLPPIDTGTPVHPRVPSLRFTLAAIFVSFASAGMLGLGLVVFLG